ncbi:MAG: N-6 DNA methylase [Sedimentisphaerales bacterium]|nr:N-6 DNA methylase [Sedimentisphaerales bacterium]
MKAFRPYVTELERFTTRLLKCGDISQNQVRITSILNGEVSTKLRIFVPLKNRREIGAFFTGHHLAQRISRQATSKITSSTIIADIACGAGDLLLACAQKLPIAENVIDTLNLWGQHLMGFDIHPEFIYTTKIRLVLLAISRHKEFKSPVSKNPDSFFPMITQKDFLTCPEEVSKATHIVINPPYNESITLPNCIWASGSVSAASLFMDACILNASPGTHVSAILPDVLRSGSSYEKWRNHIESLCSKISINRYGQFDEWADIDVFTLNLQTGNTNKKRKPIWRRLIRQPHNGIVSDYFSVHVGSLVPHRHPKKGPSVAYIHSKILPEWGRVNRINERRKFNGTLFQPPLVLVRRTSRPGNNRAIGTIITGKRKIAVENHLLVLLPNNKTIAQCTKLLRVLKSTQTNKWLDNRIRCRHLTVQSIKDLPWWSSE